MNQAKHHEAQKDPMARLGLIIGVVIVFLTVGFLVTKLLNTIEKNSAKASEDKSYELAAAAERLKPIGGLSAGGTAAPTAARSGEEIVNGVCQACHGNPGIPGSPKLGNTAEWEPRMANGFDALATSATNGKGAMPPKGGDTSLSDAELKSAIAYMLKESGIDVPEAAATDAAAAPAAPAVDTAAATETAATPATDAAASATGVVAAVTDTAASAVEAAKATAESAANAAVDAATTAADTVQKAAEDVRTEAENAVEAATEGVVAAKEAATAAVAEATAPEAAPVAVPTEAAPAEAAPAVAAPAEAAPAEAAPAVAAPTEAVPAEAVPAEAAPVEAAPVEAAPAEAASTEAASTEAAPAETAPAETAPAETAPAETAPAETAPAETAPVEAPAEAAPEAAAKPATEAAPEATTSAVTGDAAAGQKVYNTVCMACHNPAVAPSMGSPALGDKAAWAPRIATGFEALKNSVINGKGVMPPRAGRGDTISDEDIANGIAYMISQAQ